MGKVNKEEYARISGMQQALRICKEAKGKGLDPVDVLQKEVDFRCRKQIPVGVPQKALDELTASVKQHMFDTMKIMVGLLLHDELGFGKQRLERFWNRFEDQCECVYKNYATFEDMAQALEEEAKVRMEPIRANNKNIHI